MAKKYGEIMAIESISNVASAQQANATATNNQISQDEFIKLFLAQLNYQDPMEPVNNREFLAQLAQFSSLEQMRQSNANLQSLITMNTSGQALDLLGKNVDVKSDLGVDFNGVIEAIHYTSNGPSLTVKNEDGSFLDNITLSQITIVKK